MLFSHPTFLYLFLPTVLIVYYGLLRKSRLLQNIFLCGASLFFYAWGEPKFVIMMIVSIIINWWFGLTVERCRSKPALQKALIVIDVVLNLGLLFAFKYLNFTEDIVKSLTGVDWGLPTITLPIGISFFTFQAMSYVIDVYREKGMAQKNILYVGLYVSFFPQLIAGPIVRYETIAEQISNRRETLEDVTAGFTRFLIGLGKKVLLSNSFAVLADATFNANSPSELSVMFSWLGALAYTLQIYFDFCGYSDMAIGLGKMFGFHFLENFNYPYISTSISEFWRRWHISLGTWFRDYVYFPLGGSRVNKYRLIFNLFVVWFLTGLWHGANFTFILWGLMYFVLITIEKLTKFDKKKGRFLNIFKWLYTMLFVVIGWVFFRSESISGAFEYLGSMFGVNGNVFIDGMFTGYFKQNLVLLCFGVLFSIPFAPFLKKRLKDSVFADILYIIAIVSVFVLCVASLVSNSYNPFIYFNF